MSLDVVLDWKGPFNLSSQRHRASFSPPPASGVYLWTVANDIAPRIAYIGEASNLADRFYEHVFCMLGGAYCLYDDDHLLRGTNSVPTYRPSQENLFTTFLDNPQRFSMLAIHNLMSYWFWWAFAGAERTIREAIESGLIEEARRRGEPLQNDRVSRGSHCSHHVRIKSVFTNDSKVTGVGDCLEYGNPNLSV